MLVALEEGIELHCLEKGCSNFEDVYRVQTASDLVGTCNLDSPTT